MAWIAWSVLASVVLTLLGLGWTTWGLREAGLLAALAAAPAAGLGALILGGLAADRLALPAALGGAALAGALALGGYALAARHGTVEPAEQAGA